MIYGQVILLASFLGLCGVIDEVDENNMLCFGHQLSLNLGGAVSQYASEHISEFAVPF